ncbi:bifunctional [glutamate--ammonia ligase]-adenylyl-L-tyrosine phosphorylase/[glutamate--ammonia-ligase] adenylyltransferase [Amphibiibacter pelophylacis]|uniref:Bifunctional [glutamate--ammonia ligase]-adenylyl-L-tyrosine phosphorylase/[glutamate--ammonia-ligase] adenylyltransferase n=1 Tax=Amphibiibacter pelophylacis TaxID=1799477 RepID=A0ACC6P3R2_9BURK
MTLPRPRGASADHSRFVQRVRRRYELDMPLLPAGLPDRHSLIACVQALQAQSHDLGAALRITRQLALERLAVLDTEDNASLRDITRSVTELAETALNLALDEALAQADALYGPPLNEAGERIDFWILGMGKLGGKELNVSSDIDLIYVYEEDGQTRPKPGSTAKSVSAHEYFAQVARRLSTLVGDTTEHGFVFRVDLDLRPNGQSGPIAVSMAMLEEYLLVQGREWERFAWLKSRVIAPWASVSNGRALQLRSLVSPFVYRRYLDYSIFEALRLLHRKIREDHTRRAAGRPLRACDVKLARGGIREIEFIVQLLQVVRGGQFPEIRSRSTLPALDKLAAKGLITPATARQLAADYTFLRRTEHRIQFLDDQQTHTLPAEDRDLDWIARSLNDPDLANGCDLMNRYNEVRERVSTEFDALLHDGQAPGECRNCQNQAVPVDSPALLQRLPDSFAEQVRVWVQQPRIQGLSDAARLRLGKLLVLTGKALEAGQCPTSSGQRFLDWVGSLGGRESYLALLVERRDVLDRLLRVLGFARWPMRYLNTYPGVIDELADNQGMAMRFDRASFDANMASRYDALTRAGEDTEEALLDTLRRAHQSEVFATLVREVDGRIAVEEVADDLSLLADAMLDVSLRWAWQHLRQRHRPAPRLALIAYGKLGGKELGYGSDLDLVFLYDDSQEDDPDAAQEIYTRFVRKLIGWLTLRTNAGALFDIDTALRPNGNSGLLVSSMASYARYQQGRGSNTAWTWEHQALTRARFCAGEPELAAQFDQVRREVLSSPRDRAALAQEILSMRDRVRAATPVPANTFDLKHSVGGMMDAEFTVQFLVLAHSSDHPALMDNAGNIALLQRAESMGLLPEGVGHAAADAYRELRARQHQARLDESSAPIAPDSVAAPTAAIRAAWQAVFGRYAQVASAA